MTNTNTNTTAKTAELGETVTYVSTKGFEKAAIVVGTPDSILPGHSYPELEGGERHLLILTLGGITPRMSVPSQEEALAALAESAEEGEEVTAVGYWK